MSLKAIYLLKGINSDNVIFQYKLLPDKCNLNHYYINMCYFFNQYIPNYCHNSYYFLENSCYLQKKQQYNKMT